MDESVYFVHTRAGKCGLKIKTNTASDFDRLFLFFFLFYLKLQGTKPIFKNVPFFQSSCTRTENKLKTNCKVSIYNKMLGPGRVVITL